MLICRWTCNSKPVFVPTAKIQHFLWLKSSMLCVATFNIKTSSIMTLKVMVSIDTLSVTHSSYSVFCWVSHIYCYAECHSFSVILTVIYCYSDCRLFIVILSVFFCYAECHFLLLFLVSLIYCYAECNFLMLFWVSFIVMLGVTFYWYS